MTRKIRLFGREIEWYDVKTKFKKFLRGITYTWIVQEIICSLVVSYMWLVYLTSRRKFINRDNFINPITENKPLIICSWHNRLVMMPFAARIAYKVNANYRFMSLASHHGDGRFVGRVMQKFGFQNIYGSTQDGRKRSRGIDMHSLRELIRGLKNGKGLGITPDGPRGPNQKVNGEVINIAKLSSALIIPMSITTSRFIQFRSWDQFKLPLPFSKLCFYFGDLIAVDREISDEESEVLRLKLEDDLNEAQEKSLNCAKNL